METNSQLIKKVKENNFQNIYPIAYIDGIIDKESNEKLSDILIKYNHILVPWQGTVTDTRNRVTILMRRQGLWITYINSNSEIITEVYKGTIADIINNWADDVNWEKVPDIKYVQNNASKIPDGAILPSHLSPALQELLYSHGTVINLPDDEDLEQKDTVLKLKDREYNSELASGKGYKILRKNWTNIEDKNINLLTQDTIAHSNTIYEIRYDFDLNGAEITIPEGCVLDFQGGSLKNGTIVGNNTTLLNATDNSLLLSFEGSFTDIDIKVSVFGLFPNGDGTTAGTLNQDDLFKRVNSFIKCVENIKIIFERGYYGYGSGSFVQPPLSSARLWYNGYAFDLRDDDVTYKIKTKQLVIEGNNAYFLNVYPYYIGAWEEVNGVLVKITDWNERPSKGAVTTTDGGFLNVFSTVRPIDVEIKNLTINSNMEIFNFGGTQGYTVNQVAVFYNTNKGNFTADNVAIFNNVTDAIIVASRPNVYPNKIIIQNSYFENNIRQGTSLCGGETILVENCKYRLNGRIYPIPDYRFESPWSHIDIEPTPGWGKVGNVIINNCQFEETNRYCIVSIQQNVKTIVVTNCTAVNSLPRLDYDVNGNIIEHVSPPSFIQCNATESLVINNIDLVDHSFGSASIHYQPIEEIPEGWYEGSTEDYYWINSQQSKKPFVGNVNISCNNSFTKDRKISLFSLGGDLINYKYNNITKKWDLIKMASDTGYEYGFGGTNFGSVTLNLLDSYGFDTHASGSGIYGGIIIEELNINIIESRKLYPIFNTIGVTLRLKIKTLNFYDWNMGDVATCTEPGFFVTYPKIENITYTKMRGENPGVIFSNSIGSYGIQGKNGVKKVKDVGYLKMSDGAYGEALFGGFHDINFNLNPYTNSVQVRCLNNPSGGDSLFKQYKNLVKNVDGTALSYDSYYYGSPKIYSKSFTSNQSDLVAALSGKNLLIGETIFDISKKQMIYGSNGANQYRYDGNLYETKSSGTSIDRPVNPLVGTPYFDTTINKPIWWTGSTWVDATGATV